ncbi:DUF2079 domain-containing protein [Adhaeribacter terreus]|uniref:DUF2079 domain-containing protein n=1 Tax=Adhaeribacter terreus TaxID=529703 RepID=A0ABW0E911_9BACT
MKFSKLEAFSDKHQRRILISILAFFGLCFSLLSLGNHYFFRTYAYDLGLFNNAVYDYAHFRWNDNTVKLYNNILSDHFTLLHIPFSLFYWLFGSYTLLIFQIASIIFGAVGAYRFHLLKFGKPLLSFILLLHFLSIWGIYSALAYDYHDNIIAAMMVPWFFLYFHRQKWAKASLFFLVILISKENMALWAIFLSLGLGMMYFRNKAHWKRALLFALVAAVYFIVVVKFIVPGLAVGDRSYDYVNKYAVLGNGFSEIITNSLTNPWRIIKLLFVNHTPEPENDWAKTELHAMIVASGGWSLLLQPAYLFMLIPIYAQKLFSNHALAWGINYQYSIEYVPVINFALAATLGWFSAQRRVLVALFMLVLTVAATFRSFDTRISCCLDRPAIQFYKKKHFRRFFDVSEAYQALKLIPDGVPVSASPVFVPHLANRDFVFELPFVGNSEYVMYLQNEYPEKITDAAELSLLHRVEKLQASPNWELIYNQNFILILKRKPGTPPEEPVTFK